eukprot:scaffold28990_cov63-Phaeocystis_antarctica.AAC.4
MTCTSSVRSCAPCRRTSVSSTRARSFSVTVCPSSVRPSGPGISTPLTALRLTMRSWTSCVITYRSDESTHP